MKTVMFLDVQNDCVDGIGISPRAKEVADDIVKFAGELVGAREVYTVATGLVSLVPNKRVFGGVETVVAEREGAGFYHGIDRIVDSAPIRDACTGARFPCVFKRLKDLHVGDKPEFVLCGFTASGFVIRAALFFRSMFPDARVSVLEDLSYEPAPADIGLTAVRVVAAANDIEVITSGEFLKEVKGGAEHEGA